VLTSVINFVRDLCSLKLFVQESLVVSL
jgi:hypothetical protein